MSYRMSAYGVFGIRVKMTDLVRTVESTHTDHPMPTGAKFCPECGAVSLKKEKQFALSMDKLESVNSDVEAILRRMTRDRSFEGEQIDVVTEDDDADHIHMAYIGVARKAPAAFDLRWCDPSRIDGLAKAIASIIPKEYWDCERPALWIVKHESYL